LCPMRHRAHPQRGVVLIMALIMLVIITLLATFSLRNSTSTEMVSGNVRTTELATQVAESALKYCEDQAFADFQFTTGATTATAAITPAPYQALARWNCKNNSATCTGTGDYYYWDGSSSLTSPVWHAITDSSVVTASTTFKRPPECMIERVFNPASTDTSINTATFIITVRGFGPEVPAADATRSRPLGTEVWLQSTVSF